MVNGPIIVFDKRNPRMTSFQMHLNPDLRITDELKNGKWERLNLVPLHDNKRTAILGGRLFEKMPSGSAVTVTSDAMVLPQYIQLAPWRKRMKYYLSGNFKVDDKVNTVKEGYSTDVMEQLEKMAKRGKGVLLDAENSVMPSTNSLGKSYPKYQQYFGTPIKGGELKFADMSPQQVEAWNRDYGSRFGYIDSVKRTMITKVFIKK